MLNQLKIILVIIGLQPNSVYLDFFELTIANVPPLLLVLSQLNLESLPTLDVQDRP